MFSIFFSKIFLHFSYRRSIVPPMNHVKPRNGPISPRERDMNNLSYSNHQPPHYNYNNSSTTQNSTVNNSNPSNQPAASSPNSDLINFVSGAWKEKVNFHRSSTRLKLIRNSFRWHRRFLSQKIRKNLITLT